MGRKKNSALALSESFWNTASYPALTAVNILVYFFLFLQL